MYINPIARCARGGGCVRRELGGFSREGAHAPVSVGHTQKYCLLKSSVPYRKCFQVCSGSCQNGCLALRVELKKNLASDTVAVRQCSLVKRRRAVGVKLINKRSVGSIFTAKRKLGF